MAMISCPDCGKQVSEIAPSCPSCGCPIKDASSSSELPLPSASSSLNESQPTQGKRRGLLKRPIFWVFLALLGWVVYTQETKKPYDWADQYRKDAVPKCSAMIEEYAKYGYEWKSMRVEYVPRFPYATRVNPSDDTVIRFRGKANGLLFKNAFNIMIPVEYSCDYDTKTKSVINVMVREK